MPNIAFAPAPRVDPYAGKAGEYLADLITSIAQIGQLRRNREEKEEIFDIISSGRAPEQINADIIGAGERGNRYAMNLYNQARMSEALKTDTQRQQEQADLEGSRARTANVRARTEYWEAGGGQDTDEDLYKFWSTEQNKAAGSNFIPGATEEQISMGYRGTPENQERYDLSTLKLKPVISRLLEKEQPASASTVSAPGGGVDMIRLPGGIWPKTPESTGYSLAKQAESEWKLPLKTPGNQEQAIENEVAGYIEQLDEDDKKKWNEIINSGDENAIKQAIQAMRNTYGNTR